MKTDGTLHYQICQYRVIGLKWYIITLYFLGIEALNKLSFFLSHCASNVDVINKIMEIH